MFNMAKTQLLRGTTSERAGRDQADSRRSVQEEDLSCCSIVQRPRRQRLACTRPGAFSKFIRQL
jgi:hypothetical protein